VELARELEAARKAHTSALVAFAAEGAAELATERAAHGTRLAALQDGHRAEVERLRASHASEVEALSTSHAAAASRLKASLAAMEEVEAKRTAELQTAEKALEAARCMRVKAETDALAVKEAAEAVGDAAEAVEEAVQSLLASRAAATSSSSNGEGGLEGAGEPRLARLASLAALQGDRGGGGGGALAPPSPQPPVHCGAQLEGRTPYKDAQWYAQRSQEELVRCGLFEEALEMQRAELAAKREALGEDYRAFKAEVEAVAGLSTRIGGQAGSAAAIRARQAELRLSKAQLEERIKALNSDIVGWNSAAEFAKERWMQAKALQMEAAGDPRAYSEHRCAEREARLAAMDSLEFMAVEKKVKAQLEANKKG
jgi:hypothetical protein